MERSQRITRINALLSRKGGATLAQIMEGLEVSRATVNRDLQLMRDQMNAPIVWDSHSGTYYLDSAKQTGPEFMLPGMWISPAQAYALLTLNNMVEKIAPSVLGPFLDPMRGMLKRMLYEAKFDLYGLDRKIEIDMPAMPTLGDLDFSNLIDALIQEQRASLIVRSPDGTEQTISGTPAKLRITAHGWSVQIQSQPTAEPVTVNVADIQKVLAANESAE